MKLTDDNAIDIRYEAETDKPTIVNMTNHSYFNLDGDAASNADHLLMVDADYYTPVDSTFMTTGEIVPVEGTPMDFRTPTPVGARINDYDFVQLKNGNGYDHNWVLNAKGDISRKCASLESPKTGILFRQMFLGLSYEQAFLNGLNVDELAENFRHIYSLLKA